MQKRFMRAISLQTGYRWFRKEYAARIDAHIEALRAHRVWMIKQQFGENVRWVTTWVAREGAFSDCDRGSGYRGEILQYIFWFKDEDTDDESGSV